MKYKNLRNIFDAFIILMLAFVLIRMTVNVDTAAPSAPVAATFLYTFNSDGVLEESSEPDKSTSPYWWLNSGGYLYIEDGVGKTAQGDIDRLSRWRVAHARSNSNDTESGFRPQNIFRIFTRSEWRNVEQQLFFKINYYDISPSQNRNASNGVFLMSRFEDSNDLYYAGIRVDGYAIVKKKSNGVYYALASAQVFGGAYDRERFPNLLPLNSWIGLRARIVDNIDGTVSITLSMNLQPGDDGQGNWVEILHATDDGISFGGPAILASGPTGIRTDFMDVEFRNYQNTEI